MSVHSSFIPCLWKKEQMFRFRLNETFVPPPPRSLEVSFRLTYWLTCHPWKCHPLGNFLAPPPRCSITGNKWFGLCSQTASLPPFNKFEQNIGFTILDFPCLTDCVYHSFKPFFYLYVCGVRVGSNISYLPDFFKNTFFLWSDLHFRMCQYFYHTVVSAQANGSPPPRVFCSRLLLVSVVLLRAAMPGFRLSAGKSNCPLPAAGRPSSAARFRIELVDNLQPIHLSFVWSCCPLATPLTEGCVVSVSVGAFMFVTSNPQHPLAVSPLIAVVLFSSLQSSSGCWILNGLFSRLSWAGSTWFCGSGLAACKGSHPHHPSSECERMSVPAGTWEQLSFLGLRGSGGWGHQMNVTERWYQWFRWFSFSVVWTSIPLQHNPPNCLASLAVWCGDRQLVVHWWKKSQT